MSKEIRKKWMPSSNPGLLRCKQVDYSFCHSRSGMAGGFATEFSFQPTTAFVERGSMQKCGLWPFVSFRLLFSVSRLFLPSLTNICRHVSKISGRPDKKLLEQKNDFFVGCEIWSDLQSFIVSELVFNLNRRLVFKKP